MENNFEDNVDTSEFVSVSRIGGGDLTQSPDFKPINVFDRYIIIDNFYQNPEMIRNFAISGEKEPESGGNYSGVMTNDAFITQEHLDAIKIVVGQDVFPSTQLTGKFRFTKEYDTWKQDIHFDPGDNNSCWAGVVYLTPNVDIDGTHFWKHKRTGLESIPLTLEGIQQFGWEGVDDLKVFLDTEGIDRSLWDRTLTIPYKYNRLVLFRPWLFHSPGNPFGNTLENCRLIQTFFFSTLDKPL
nr:MAG: hypothetical protein [Caudoviricetes sp.]